MTPDLTLGELAHALRISTRTARTYLLEGKFPMAYRVGDPDTGEWRIPREDIERYKHDQRPNRTPKRRAAASKPSKE